MSQSYNGATASLEVWIDETSFVMVLVMKVILAVMKQLHESYKENPKNILMLHRLYQLSYEALLGVV